MSNSQDSTGSDLKLTPLEQKNLEKMESLLDFSSRGVHVLFDHASIAEALNSATDDRDFFDFSKMKKAQDGLTELISKNTLLEKMDFLKALDKETLHMLIRTYFHIVETNVKTKHRLSH